MNTRIIYIFNLVFTLLLSLLSLVPSYNLKEQGIKNRGYIFVLLSFILGIECFFFVENVKEYLAYYIVLIVLIVCAYIDKKTKEIPDISHVIIIISALLTIDFPKIYINLISLCLTYVLFHLLSKKFPIGGGDIKMISCLAFCLKLRIIPFIVLTIISFVVIEMIKKQKLKKKNKEETETKISYALFPHMIIPFLVSIIL